MAIMWMHKFVRNVAELSELGSLGSFSATGQPAVLLSSLLDSSSEAFWCLLHKSGRVCDSGQHCPLSEDCSIYPQVLVHEQLKHDVNLRFSQQFSSLSLRVPQFDLKFRNREADGNRRILQEFRMQVRHHSRPFGTISWRKDLEEQAGEEILEEAPPKSVNQPLGFNSRTSSKILHPKERSFDDIIGNEKKLRIILSIKELLGAQPYRSMTILDLGKSKGHIGFKGNGRLVSFLKSYPGVFRVHETAEFGKLPCFQFTPEAEAAFDAEIEIRKRINDEVVTKLRKLLMMSSDRTLSLSKIAHIGRDVGLPDDFRKSLVYKYPNYFRVIESKDPLNAEDPKLELVRWSTRLAVTEAEKKSQEQMQEHGRGSLPKLDIKIPKRYRLFNKDKYVVHKFDEVDCPSPYQDASHLHPRSVEFEKRAVLLVQELLSLTLEKRVLVDHLTHFRKEFNFSNKVHGMLIRHPEHFYVSRKGSRDTVFLRGLLRRSMYLDSVRDIVLLTSTPWSWLKQSLQL